MTDIIHCQVPMFGTSVACDLAYTEYEGAAKALGAEGRALTKEGEIDEALEFAQKVSDQRPVLINAHIGKTKFREGSLSV